MGRLPGGWLLIFEEGRIVQAMDVRNPPKPAASRGSKSALLHRDELRSILSSLSHELRHPLISLRAGFDLLLGPSGVEIARDQRNHLLTMISLCDDLLQLTHSYLDFANLVQGTRPILWGTFSLGALFAEIDSQFAPLASRRGIEWEMCPADPDATIRTDVSRCQQILGNLASNALGHTSAGGSVRIHGQVQLDAWSLSIVDTGAGIPPEEVGKVFEPFYRLGRDRYAGVEGNGLGLTVCRELVEQLRGEIDLESTLGRGTTVTVRFPHDPDLPPATGTRRG
jgi:signal transduction histidine kinase